MQTSDLRIALFSGNYNITVDGANKALNRLVGYLLSQGAQVRVYSPTVDHPDMEPVGDLVSLPSVPIPTRSEYRLSSGVNARIKRDLEAFNPNVLHVSAPDVSAHRAVTWARRRGLPVVASVHTRFDTYMRYYRLGWTAPLIVALQRRFYRRCDALVAPSESMTQMLREQRMNTDIGIWSRGVDRNIFNPGRRDLAWRRELGLGHPVRALGVEAGGFRIEHDLAHGNVPNLVVPPCRSMDSRTKSGHDNRGVADFNLTPTPREGRSTPARQPIDNGVEIGKGSGQAQVRIDDKVGFCPFRSVAGLAAEQEFQFFHRHALAL